MRWKNPNEWLIEKIHEWDIVDMQFAFLDLVTASDPDTIQDVFQSDMTKDGYFSEGDEENE